MKYDITTRELEILELIAKGYDDKEIKEKLNISQGSVNTYKQNLYQKCLIYDGTQQNKSGKRLRLALYYLKRHKEILDDIKY